MVNLLQSDRDSESKVRKADGLQKAKESMRFKVLIADDHGVVRKGLRLLLEQYSELEVIGEAANGRDAVTMAATLSPQIVVMDVAMPILNGIEAAEQIINANSNIGVIILTMHADESYLLRALNVGIKGYLLKESAEEDLLLAIRSVARGKPFSAGRLMRPCLRITCEYSSSRGSPTHFTCSRPGKKKCSNYLPKEKQTKKWPRCWT